MKWRYVLAAFLLLSFISSGAAQATASNLDSTVTTTDEFVMGREVTSEFTYDINDPYVPVDTALVIDESGSMDGVMSDAKDGAESYVDSTNTGQGDENAVVEFEDSASTIQSLTGNKQDAKDAINTISDGGGTDLPGGVSQGTDALSSGSNPQQVMIVLADGGGGDPQTEADDARDKGIDVHGIMYGSGASTSEFESLTGASECTTNSAENSDGDKCWYAETGTIDEVYTSIRESTEVETDADLKMNLKDFAYPVDSYDNYNDLGGNQEFIREYSDVEEGTYTKEFVWRPTVEGDNVDDMVTGNSVLELTSGSDTNTNNFGSDESREVKYVDFDVENSSILRRDGEVEVNFTIVNRGNVESRGRDVWIADGLSGDSNVNHVSENIPPLDSDSDEKEEYTLTYDTSTTDVFDSPEDIYIRADPSGRWDSTSYGHGDTLEPSDDANNVAGDNNLVNLGYPMRLDDIDPEPTDGVFWGDEIQPEFTYAHPRPGAVDGLYNYTNDTTQMDTNKDMDLSTNTDEAVLSTTEPDEYFIDYAERWYNFTVHAEDDRGATTISKASYYVENPKPTASAISPVNDGVVSEFPVDLSVEVNDENSEYHGRTLDVTVYDHNGQELTTASPVPEDTVDYEWEIPDALATEYDWTVEIEDKWDTTTTKFDFTKIVGRTYRSDLNIDLNFSSIVMNARDNEYTELTVENNAPNDKNLAINLTGVEAEFLDGDSVKTFPDFKNQTTRSFTVRVTPDQPTDKDLVIVATNNNIGIETEKTIPVTTLRNSQESNEVPGIGLINLVFLLVVSSFLYFRNLP